MFPRTPGPPRRRRKVKGRRNFRPFGYSLLIDRCKREIVLPTTICDEMSLNIKVRLSKRNEGVFFLKKMGKVKNIEAKFLLLCSLCHVTSGVASEAW